MPREESRRRLPARHVAEKRHAVRIRSGSYGRSHRAHRDRGAMVRKVMSLDRPNEYEWAAVEDYAAAVRREEATIAALAAATQERARAQAERQARWRTVSGYVNQGLIEPGIYRLNKVPGLHA